MNNELFSTTGYRMDFFQMYNWGVFDKAIYTVDCKGKSTLLTGENGSGKTSLVDAIMTLLVPQNMRFYNQSSGSNRKHDRNEESYVLGAYGTRQEDNSDYAKTQTLRDTSAYSILTACFTDTSLQSSVSLLQVRYFTGESLQRVFALSRTKVSIQDIKNSLAKRNISIDRTANWKKVLSEDFGTIFFQDNFKKYCDTYSAIFGFRSDKALRLFTQIVGLKVLGNLTDFIRANMLEEHDIISRFDQLKENYTNLMQSNNEILKAKAQIELLEPIKESGENYRKLFAEKEKLEQLKQCSPIWFTSQARTILSDDLENIRDTLQINIDNKNKEEENQTSIQEEIDGIKLSIAQNAVTLRLKSIKDKIESLEKEKKFVDDTKTSYISKLNKVGIKTPLNEKEFNDTRKEIEEVINFENKRKDELDKQRIAFYANDTGTESRIDSIKNELASLGKRKSNIPLENIDIRTSICRALSYDEADIPFAGELLMVKESESKWEDSIEKLLHNFALTLLVKPEIYEEVTDYIKNTNMRGRVVYIKTEDELVLTDDDLPAENTVPGKIKVREEHELASWLRAYIKSHFDYICTDDTKELGKTSHAITSTGLIKKGLKHEKDDRKHIANASHVLGWNNSYKRQKLSSDLDDLKKANEERLIKEKEIIDEITSIDEKIRTLKNLEDIKNWSFIDTESYIQQLDNLQHEHDEILNSDMSIKELHKKLEIKTEEYKKVANRINTLTGIIAILQDKQKQKEYNLGKYNSTWELLKGNSDDEENYVQKEIFSSFEKEYEKYLQAKSIDELEKFSSLINDDIETRMEACDKKSNEIAQDFVKKMSIIKNPSQKLRESYGDWSSEFLDMEASPEYLDEYIAVYNRLKKDDLPQYIYQFQQYLHETMNDNIVDFREYINNAHQEIRAAINNLNSSLKSIIYEHNPDTHLQLIVKDSNDVRIREFKLKLKDAIPDLIKMEMQDEKYENEIFSKIKSLLDYLSSNEANRNFVLDIRNWFTFAAVENYANDNTQKQYYSDSASLSGGEKAKLTYTILASAIAYQFGINSSSASSFRFVIVDEAFSKSDAYNSEYAMRLFKQLDLQLIVVTPLDKINIVEDYISSVHMTENKNSKDSRLLGMSIETYKEKMQDAS